MKYSKQIYEFFKFLEQKEGTGYPEHFGTYEMLYGNPGGTIQSTVHITPAILDIMSENNASFPDTIVCDADIYFKDFTKNISLPKNIQCKNLHILHSDIDTIPSSWNVSEDISIVSTSIENFEIPKVDGNLFCAYAYIKKLPTGLIVNKSYTIDNVSMQQGDSEHNLPDGLQAKKLFLSILSDVTLPENLQLSELVYYTNASIDGVRTPSPYQVQQMIKSKNGKVMKVKSIN